MATPPPKAKVVVLGAGWWTQGWHLPHLHRHPDAEIIAVVDPCAAPRSAISTLVSLDEAGAKYRCQVFASFDACLEAHLDACADHFHGVSAAATPPTPPAPASPLAVCRRLSGEWEE